MQTALVVIALCILGWSSEGNAQMDIDGNWTAWSIVVKPCNKTCGGGYEILARTCTNPKPFKNGKDCEGDNETANPCNTHPCKIEDRWSDWSECDKECHPKGHKRRYSVCGADGEICEGNQKVEQIMECNTWNKTACPSPCTNYTKCPERSQCKDISTDKKPQLKCKCLMGYQLNDAGDKCIRPPPPKPTPRPIPTLPPEQKIIAVGITRTASTVIIIMVSITLILFMMLRIFTPDRIIQMNMEVALLLAHCLLMFPSETAEKELMCKTIAILLHFFFMACFMFMFLEALHMYSLVAYVVRKDGMLTPLRNMLIGWGIPMFVVLVTMSFHYDDYYGKYHCWLQMNKPIMLGEVLPLTTLLILTLILIEAAGAADYEPLDMMNATQLLSAKISQRSCLVIVILVFVSWILGVMSEYEQNLALYGTFSTINTILGICIFLLHCMGNEQVRSLLKRTFMSATKKKKRPKKK